MGKPRYSARSSTVIIRSSLSGTERRARRAGSVIASDHLYLYLCPCPCSAQGFASRVTDRGAPSRRHQRRAQGAGVPIGYAPPGASKEQIADLASPPSRATLISEIDPGMRAVGVASVAFSCSAQASRSLFLAGDRQAHVLRHPLDHFIARPVGCDDPAVATDRECEGEEQRGDLRVLPHLVVRPDGVQPDQIGHVLLDATEGRPRRQAAVPVTDFLFERRGHAPVTLAGEAR